MRKRNEIPIYNEKRRREKFCVKLRGAKEQATCM